MPGAQSGVETGKGVEDREEVAARGTCLISACVRCNDARFSVICEYVCQASSPAVARAAYNSSAGISCRSACFCCCSSRAFPISCSTSCKAPCRDRIRVAACCRRPATAEEPPKRTHDVRRRATAEGEAPACDGMREHDAASRRLLPLLPFPTALPTTAHPPAAPCDEEASAPTPVTIHQCSGTHLLPSQPHKP